MARTAVPFIPRVTASCRELAVIQFRIGSVLRQQLLMFSLLYDVAVFHDQDHIRLPYRGEPVGHDKAGPSPHHTGKGLLDPDLCAGINGRRSFIQDQHGRQT